MSPRQHGFIGEKWSCSPSLGQLFLAITPHYGRSLCIFSVSLAICATVLYFSKQLHKYFSLIRMLLGKYDVHWVYLLFSFLNDLGLMS